MKKKYKMRPMAKLVIALDILVVIMNSLLLLDKFEMVRFNLILAFGVLALLVYRIERQQKELEIVDKYVQNLWEILLDYDGYYDEETKQGSLEGLAGLVDEAMDTCKKIIRRDTKSVIYIGGNDKKYNILMEKVEGDDE